jgi:hypothetical protein
VPGRRFESARHHSLPRPRQYRLSAVKSRVGLRELVAVDMTVNLAQRDSKK